jgi:hypothetical protein
LPRRACRIVHLCCLLALLGAGCAMLLAWRHATPARTITQPFPPTPFYDVHALVHDHWQPGLAGGLQPVPGQAATLEYLLARLPHQTIRADLELTQPAGTTVSLTALSPFKYAGAQVRRWPQGPFTWSHVDLTTGLLHLGHIIFTLKAQAAPGAMPPQLRRLAFHFEQLQRPLHWGPALFFATLALLGYGALLWHVLPGAVQGARALLALPRRVRAPWSWLLGLVLLAAVLAPLTLPEWRAAKDFDDRAALGNAALMRETGWHLPDLYFRSRIRPALVAWFAPWATFLPHQISTASFTPSDRMQRLFSFFDRIGNDYGLRVYPELSLFSACVLAAGVLLLVRLGRATHAPPLLGGVLLLTTSVALWRSGIIALSDAANFTFTIAAMLAALRAWRHPHPLRLGAAGLLFGFAALLKETIVIPIGALALFQLWDLFRSPQGRLSRLGRLRAAALFWLAAALLPVVYYTFVLDTGWAEWADNTSLTRFHMAYHHYPPLTPQTGLLAFRQAFGPILPLVLLGLPCFLLLVRHRRPALADRFFLCWLLASGVIITMPFLFARFLIFIIPPVAWLAAQPLLALAIWGRKRTANPGQP